MSAKYISNVELLELAKAMRAFREAQGFTQEKLAQLLDVSIATVSRAESAQSVHIGTRAKIRRLIGGGVLNVA